MRWRACAAVVLVGLSVLLPGMDHVLETGQVDPLDWSAPAIVGMLLLTAMLRWIAGRWRWLIVIVALATVAMPPLMLCLVGSSGQSGRMAAWLRPTPARLSVEQRRPALAVLSGPILCAPPPSGSWQKGFVETPLWRILSRRFAMHPLDALDDRSLAATKTLLIVQPRALAPEEMVAMDDWVRRGGHAVLLVDADLRWADARPLGHPLRPPARTLIGPLLRHWGLTLMTGLDDGALIERRFVDGGLLQLAGASHFVPRHRNCATSSSALIARCRIGTGVAVLVADADFANDALWTAQPDRPEDSRRWTSDAPHILTDWLSAAPPPGTRKHVWLTRANGLPGALISAVAMLMIVAMVTFVLIGRDPKEDMR